MIADVTRLTLLRNEKIIDATPILDDLLSQSENLDGDRRFAFGPCRDWSHSFHDAVTIALLAFSVFENDWNTAFDQQATQIPSRVPESLYSRVLLAVQDWVNNPESYDVNDHDSLDSFVLDDVLDDGYLGTTHPDIPPVVHAFCYGSLYLVRMTEDFRVGINGSFRDLLAMNDAGLMPDAVGQLLIDGLSLAAIQRAVRNKYGG